MLSVEIQRNGWLPQKRQAIVEPIRELDKIRIVDNGEPLVDLRLCCPRLLFNKEPDPFGQPRLFYLRGAVVEMLKKTAKLLPAEHTFLIWSAYRTLDYQRTIYQKFMEDLQKQHPNWPKNILRRQTNRFVHPPDIKTPPGHTTGGAVDLTIVGPDGKELDMSSPFGPERKDARPVAATFSEGLSPEARKNRQLLISVMGETLFTNYAGEWWHWSYGDSCWAWRLERDRAIYGPAQPPTIR
jgi:D-alanyl-D-alanine dipeptidase